MKARIPNWRVYSVSFQIILVIVLSLGLFWRFDHLDRKAYWLDEAFTSFHLSGYYDREVTQAVVNGLVISVKDLHKYQSLNSNKTVAHTLQHIAATAPELPPLYFVLLRFWVSVFGDAIAAIRSFSALLSLLIFPAVYWLCQELFASAMVGWLTIALIAVSPFHVICAQEARPYTLWAALSLLSSAALLHSLRMPTRSRWAIYITVSVLGLYTHLFTLFIWLGQTSYVAWANRCSATKLGIHYFKSSAIVGVLFLPWVFYCLVHRSDEVNHVAAPIKLATSFTFIKGWARCFSLFFIDFNLDETSAWFMLVPFTIIVAASLALFAVALIHLRQRGLRSQRWFLLSAMVVPTGALILSDIVLGETRSTVARYLLPSYIAMQITVAALLVPKISQPSRYRRYWQLVLCGVITIAMMSCFTMTQSPFWWNKANDRSNAAIAMVINRSAQPLVVSDTFFVNVFALSHTLNDRVQLQLVQPSQIPIIASGFSDVWLYRPSLLLRERLQQHYQLKPVYPPVLWQVDLPH